MKIIFTVLLALLAVTTKAQDKAILEKNANMMLEFTIKENYPSMLNLIYPRFFELIPREKLLEALPKMQKGNGYTITFLETPPNFAYGEIKKIDGGSYVLIKYDLKMKMAFTEPMGDEELASMLPEFKKTMGTENITFNKQENAFLIRKRSTMIGTSDKFSGNEWKFLNNDNPELLKKLFSEKIIKELGL